MFVISKHVIFVTLILECQYIYVWIEQVKENKNATARRVDEMRGSLRKIENELLGRKFAHHLHFVNAGDLVTF